MNTGHTTSTLMTLDEAADALRISKSHLFDLLRARAMPSVKIGRRRFISRPDVDGFIVRQRAASREEIRHG